MQIHHTFKKEGYIMKHLMTLFAVLSLFFFVTGCQTLGVGIQGPGASAPPPGHYSKPGPPPHAPAHGYRHKHKGHDMEYDSGIGAYVVLNIPDTYFGKDLYIRMSTDGKWMVSTTLEGGWRVAVGSEVPPKLWKKQYEHEYENKENGKGKYKKEKKNKGKNNQNEQE
jgi:hypothetical protein